MSTPTPTPLTLEILKAAITGGSSAIRSRITYEPAGGDGTKVFPPTYEGGKYALEGHNKEAGTASRVLLDSVQAQANRMELALLEAKRRGQLSLPVITTKIEGDGLLKQFSVSSLEAPHRIADALLRDSTTKDAASVWRAPASSPKSCGIPSWLTAPSSLRPIGFPAIVSPANPATAHTSPSYLWQM